MQHRNDPTDFINNSIKKGKISYNGDEITDYMPVVSRRSNRDEVKRNFIEQIQNLIDVYHIL